MREVVLKYIEEIGITNEEYITFLEKHYKERAHDKAYARRWWYSSKGEVKILLALIDGKIVGQNCAFKDTAVINGAETIIWWGCDAFVLSETRGMGIGKKMQMKLHNELPNFCSAWYSPVNGIIKKKCGSKPLFSYNTAYYPMSSFLKFYLIKVFKKVFKRDINFSYRIPYIYYYINSIFKKRYNFSETELCNIVYEFIDNSTLKEYDFYVKRDKEYLEWRYKKNPNLKYFVVKVENKGKIEAVVMFTEIFTYNKLSVSNILDVFKDVNSKITDKDIVLTVGRFFKKKKEGIDGINFLCKCSYFPKIVHRIDFLTTIETDKIIMHPYVSYSDQDMTQMY